LWEILSRLMKVKDIREAARWKKLLRFLEGDTPAGEDVDHPELGRGAAAWVRALRRESDKRVLSADELEDNLERQEPKVKGQIRKSGEEYRRGKPELFWESRAESRPDRRSESQSIRIV
jgi:Sec-independent protein translocase protein TatA